MTSLLEEEIRSQPEALARLLEQETERVGRIVAEIPEFQYSIIAARGTSGHAATYAKYIWAAMAGARSHSPRRRCTPCTRSLPA